MKCKDCGQEKMPHCFKVNDAGLRHTLCFICVVKRKKAQVDKYNHYYGISG